MSRGYIALFRSIKDQNWYKNSDRKAVFLHLLISAAHKKINVVFRGCNVTVKAGDFVSSYEQLGRDLGMSKLQIQRAVKFFVQEGQVSTVSARNHTVFSIKNWRKFQEKSDTPTDTPSDTLEAAKNKGLEGNRDTSNDTASDTQNKNDNKNKRSILSDSFEFWWSEYPGVRKSQKAKCFKKYCDYCKALDNDGITDLTNRIIADITTRIKNCEDVKYIPLTTTYTNQKRWEDGQ